MFSLKFLFRIPISSFYPKFRNIQNVEFSQRNYSCSCNGGSIQSKVAIVTGAAKGIGLEIAKGFLKAGAKKVVLSDVLVKECEKAAVELNQTYCDKVFYQPCDVTKPTEIEKMLQCAHDRFGQIDIFVNNAGILADSIWDKCVDINIKGLISGTFLAMKYMGAHECRGKGGVVINVSSILGISPFSGSPVYTGSKHFVVGFTRAIGSKHYYDLTKVKVMTIGPGLTDTNLVSESKKLAMKDFGDLSKVFDQELLSLPLQKPEEVCKCILKMLEDGTNGSYWISEANECYKLKIPDRKSMKDKEGDKKACGQGGIALCLAKEQKKTDCPKKEEKKTDSPKKEEKKVDCPPKVEKKVNCLPKKEKKSEEKVSACKKDEKVKPVKKGCSKKEEKPPKTEKKKCAPICPPANKETPSASVKKDEIKCAKKEEKSTSSKKEDKQSPPTIMASPTQFCQDKLTKSKDKKGNDCKTSNLMECTNKCLKSDISKDKCKDNQNKK